MKTFVVLIHVIVYKMSKTIYIPLPITFKYCYNFRSLLNIEHHNMQWKHYKKQ